MRIEGVFFLFSLSLSLLTCPVYAQCEGGRCNGDNNGDGEVSISELIQSVNVALGGCGEDTCQVPFPNALPATGQTTAYQADRKDSPGPVDVPDDGIVQAGRALSYVDNGDGTITDLNTGLMWEKKIPGMGLHQPGKIYSWSYSNFEETIWDWLDEVNAEGGTGFAGYADWRIPNIRELQSIVNYEIVADGQHPTVDSVFDTCWPPCTVCSCTEPYPYWSSTSYAKDPTKAWYVHFAVGEVHIGLKTLAHWVRAVRGP